jgi:hypothetical protein
VSGREISQPKMHVEGDRLYVCTSQGLYAKDSIRGYRLRNVVVLLKLQK